MTNKNKGFLKAFSNFKISKHAKLWGILPAAIVLITIIIVVSLGVTGGSFSNAVGIGIDFEGGTMLTVTLGDEAMDNYDENRVAITNTIESYGVEVSYVQQQEANNRAQSSISFRYKNISNNDDEINDLNERIKTAVEEMYANSNIATFNISYESIGATAANDLLSKAGIALAVSTVLILIYIIIRFTLVSGVAAIVALLHDVVIMFCLTVICRIQINSSYVAAMITIIAYSINNTIIIFDRCREEIKPLKGQKNINYNDIGDKAVRENLNRSIFTTITTMVTIIFLAILGSETIREFCVPIILGLLAGLYSSVFLATPLWSALGYASDKAKAKYAGRNAVSYDKKKDEDEEDDLTYPKREVSDDDDFSDNSKPKRAGEKKTPQKKKAVYKYSKKNTTFKKK